MLHPTELKKKIGELEIAPECNIQMKRNKMLKRS